MFYKGIFRLSFPHPKEINSGPASLHPQTANSPHHAFSEGKPPDNCRITVSDLKAFPRSHQYDEAGRESERKSESFRRVMIQSIFQLCLYKAGNAADNAASSCTFQSPQPEQCLYKWPLEKGRSMHFIIFLRFGQFLLILEPPHAGAFHYNRPNKTLPFAN